MINPGRYTVQIAVGFTVFGLLLIVLGWNGAASLDRVPGQRAGPSLKGSAPPSETGAPGARPGDARRMDPFQDRIRDVPDFPKPGIVFKDIMPLLADAAALRETVDQLAAWAEPRRPDIILGAEARGFITGGALACKLGCGFVAARKPGKLPWRTVSAKYALEYGFDALELHADAIREGQRVLVHDDVLATGGTARAKVDLVEQLGGTVVGLAFLIEIRALDGRAKLDGYDVCSLVEA